MSRVDLELGRRAGMSDVISCDDEDDDGSLCFSDADDGGSCYSQFYSTAGGSYDDYSFECVLNAESLGGAEASRASSACSDCSVEAAVVVAEVKLQLQLSKLERERDCRICHLGLESNGGESGPPIELGCCCKDDLGAAHKNCAETWFKIKGNKTCEICHSIARNVAGTYEAETIEQPNEAETSTVVSAIPVPGAPPETRHFWQGHRFLNFMLACMIFAFVISWLFHFDVPS